jgi:FixJ family two-component response regulator
MPLKHREAQPNHTRRIFVVDDDPAVRHSLTFVLGTEGYEVAAFSSGTDVLKEDVNGCACMVIDYRLPDMNGLDLADRLRAQGVKVPTILITSLPPSEVLQRAAAAGVRVIEKPLMNWALRDAIHAALD